jgi:hypothetical protein
MMHRLLFDTTGFNDTEATLAEGGGIGGRTLAEHLRLEVEHTGGQTDPTVPVRGGWKFYGFLDGEEYVFTTSVTPKPGAEGVNQGLVTIDKNAGLLGRFFKRPRMEDDSPVTGIIGGYLDRRFDVENLQIET